MLLFVALGYSRVSAQVQKLSGVPGNLAINIYLPYS